MGTTLLCASVGGILLFIAGVRHLFVWPFVALAGTALTVLIMNWENRMRRVLAFLDPEGRKMDEAYQLWQGMLGFAVGGRDGAGLGQGMQQDSFLPEAHTDFVFAIVGEEMGLLFTMGVAVGFLAIFCIVCANLRRQQDVFRFNLCLGATLFIVLQALINMGVVTGLLPTKGMSLPFISYGGTNLVMMFVLVGLILNCMRTASRIPLTGGRELP
jgi:cell division protein FtsW